MWFPGMLLLPAVVPVDGLTFLAAVIKVWARKSVASQTPIFGMLECVDSRRSSHHPLALSTYLTGSHRIGPDSDKRSLPRGLFFIFYL